jgi:hypothetical protein
MAKDKLTDYSSTASDNLDVGGISVAEGMLPSGVNNAIREQMSHLADFAAGTTGVDVLKLQDDTDTNSIKLQAPASVTADTTFTLPDGDGASGQTMITDGAGTLSWAAPYGNRNLIINGAMQVAQRGTSVTGLTSSSTYHTVDRWQFNMGSIGTFSISQSTTAPSGFSNSLKLSCTTANASPAAGAYLQLIHKIEGQNLQHLKKGASDAESVTLSFWCRCSKTGDFVIELRDGANSRHIGSLVTISSADTWEYKTITFAGDTTGTLANDNTTGFELDIWLSAGTDFTSGTLPASWASSTNANRAAGVFNLAASTDDFYITGVQLEVGEQATPFEHRSYGDELARCQRYYQNYVDNKLYFNGTNEPSSEVGNGRLLPTQMRVSPTVGNKSTSSGSVGTYAANAQTIRYLNTGSHGGGGFNVGFDLDAEL